MKVLDLFSGIGGFSRGLERAGMETIAFCEIESYPQAVLRHHWPDVPIYDDVRRLTADRLISDGVGLPDVICGGFPCQDLSAAGSSAGIGPETRSGLFSHMLRLAQECGCPYILFENVARLLSGPSGQNGKWFGEFLWALAEIRYDAEWFCLTAASIGAPHERDRIWIVAYPNEAQLERGSISRRVYEEHAKFSDSCWGKDKPGVVRTLNGVPAQSHRLAALGNAVVPQIPEIIGRAIMESVRTTNTTNAQSVA